MKRLFIPLFLVLAFASAAPVYAEGAPAAEAPAAEAPAEPAAAPAPEAPEEEGSIVDSVKPILMLVLGLIGAGLSTAGTALVLKLLKKAGIETSAETEKSIRKIVDSGLRRVEVWAAEEEKQSGKKPKSTSKLQKGVEKIDSMLTAFGIKKMAAAKIEELIEERLVAKKEKAGSASDPS